MNAKLIKSFVATFVMGTLSLGASAGFALPVSAHAGDIVAPTEPVTGLCGQSGTAVATLRPGEILTGSVSFANGQGSATVADSSGSYSQSFSGNGSTNGQPFTIMNISNNIEGIYSCKADPSADVTVSAQQQQQQQQQQSQQQSVSTQPPININVDTHVNNDNSNHNDVNNQNNNELENKNTLSNHNNNHNNKHNNHNNKHNNHNNKHNNHKKHNNH